VPPESTGARQWKAGATRELAEAACDEARKYDRALGIASAQTQTTNRQRRNAAWSLERRIGQLGRDQGCIRSDKTLSEAKDVACYTATKSLLLAA
jgi:hypothetical protein